MTWFVVAVFLLCGLAAALLLRSVGRATARSHEEERSRGRSDVAAARPDDVTAEATDGEASGSGGLGFFDSVAVTDPASPWRPARPSRTERSPEPERTPEPQRTPEPARAPKPERAPGRERARVAPRGPSAPAPPPARPSVEARPAVEARPVERPAAPPTPVQLSDDDVWDRILGMVRGEHEEPEVQEAAPTPEAPDEGPRQGGTAG